MEEPIRSSDPGSSSYYAINREESGAEASSSSSGAPHRYHHQFENSEVEEQQNGVVFRGNFFAFDDVSAGAREDNWSCVIVVLTFWFFVSMTLIMGIYGAETVMLGPNCSILFRPNPLFVQSIKVDEFDGAANGIELYGFYKSPPLDVETIWSESYNAAVTSVSHKAWILYLNEGAHVNISYTVNSTVSLVYLVIAEGNEGLAEWLEDPTYPNTTLSWNIVQGSGIIQQDIYKSSNYYIALGNLNSEAVEVELNVKVRDWMYNTTESYYKCTFSQGFCSLSVLFPKGNAVALTSAAGINNNSSSDELSVQLSYGPRWITYIFGVGGMTVVMLGVFNILNKFHCNPEDETRNQHMEGGIDNAPLLSRKDDDLSSWGSSYDSLSNDEDDLEEFLAASTSKGASQRDDENNNITRRLCAICFDAPRDCFFLPCGHCVACFECGTRIAEVDGTCPICRRIMRKVRKIFTV